MAEPNHACGFRGHNFGVLLIGSTGSQLLWKGHMLPRLPPKTVEAELAEFKQALELAGRKRRTNTFDSFGNTYPTEQLVLRWMVHNAGFWICIAGSSRGTIDYTWSDQLLLSFWQFSRYYDNPFQIFALPSYCRMLSVDCSSIGWPFHKVAKLE